MLCKPSCNQRCFGVSWELSTFLWNVSNILLCTVLCCAWLMSCIKYPFVNYQIDTKKPLFEWIFGSKFQKITLLACSWNSQLLNWTPCTATTFYVNSRTILIRQNRHHFRNNLILNGWSCDAENEFSMRVKDVCFLSPFPLFKPKKRRSIACGIF